MNRKTIARFAGYSAGAAMVLGFAAPVGAQTIAELQAQIAALMAQLQSLSGGSSVSTGAITSDLTIGSSGAQVSVLQSGLVAQGYLTMPAGVPMGYFGALTKEAVARWQAAKGLPATGYFGPLSRAAWGGTTTGGTTSGGTVVGGGSSGPGSEGSINVDQMSSLSNESADEGEEDVEILGVEIEAEDSDMTIDRVDVDFTLDAAENGSEDLEDYITEVSIWLDGEKLASQDVDEGDEEDDTFSFRFSGLNGMVEEDETAELVVAISAQENLDAADVGDDWDVSIPANGIRAVDTLGISDTYEAAANATEFDVTELAGVELQVSDADNNPEVMDIEVDDEEETEGVTLLVMDLEAEGSDIVVESIPVLLVTSVDGVDDVANTAYLFHGSTELDSVSITATGTTFLVTFDDLDLEIAEDDTETLTVKVDLNDTGATFVAGTTIAASTTAQFVDTIDADDEKGDSLDASELSGSASGELQTARLIGAELSLNSTEDSVTVSDSAPDLGTFEFVFDVTAFGDDIFLSATSTSGETNAIVYSLTGGTVSSSTLACSGCDEESDAFEVQEGTTEEFTLTVIVTGNSSFTDVEVTGVKWGDSAASNTENTTTVEDWESDSRFLSAT